MKIKDTACNGMDIELKAKFPYGDKSSQEAAEYVWNYISILAFEAAERYRQCGCTALATEAEKFSRQIYDALKAKGLYKD